MTCENSILFQYPLAIMMKDQLINLFVILTSIAYIHIDRKGLQRFSRADNSIDFSERQHNQM